MKLHEALHVAHKEVIAFTGAGGKTSALVQLGNELHQAGWRILATSTTRIAEDQLSLFPHVMRYTGNISALSQDLAQHRYTFAYTDIREGKAYGFSPEGLAEILAAISLDALLIEADGARRRFLKAPYPHEPVIPPQTTLVVPLVSYLSIGQPLDETHVYNPQAIADKLGYQLGVLIQPEWIAAILSDADMGLKGVPATARIIAFINAVPELALPQAGDIARMALTSQRLQGVLLGDTRDENPIFEAYFRDASSSAMR